MKFNLNIGQSRLRSGGKLKKTPARKKALAVSLSVASRFEDAIRRGDHNETGRMLDRYGTDLALGVSSSGKPRGWTMWLTSLMSMSPLELAAFSGNEFIFLQILERGARHPGALMRHGAPLAPDGHPPMTFPVELAARFLGPKAIKASMLQQPFVNIGPALVWAIRSGKADNIAVLIKLSGGPISDRGLGQDSLLVDALTIGRSHTAFEYLLDHLHFTDISSKTETPMVALLNYISRQKINVKTAGRLITKLLSRLPDQLQNVSGPNRDWPVHIAARLGLTSEIKLILERDPSSLHARNRLANTPLIEAIIASQLPAVELFVRLNHAKSLLDKNNLGVTALHAAAFHGLTSTYDAILAMAPSAGSAKTNSGKLPHDMIVKPPTSPNVE